METGEKKEETVKDKAGEQAKGDLEAGGEGAESKHHDKKHDDGGRFCCSGSVLRCKSEKLSPIFGKRETAQITEDRLKEYLANKKLQISVCYLIFKLISFSFNYNLTVFLRFPLKLFVNLLFSHFPLAFTTIMS